MADYYTPKALHYLKPEAVRLDIEHAIAHRHWHRLRGMLRSIYIGNFEECKGQLFDILQRVTTEPISYRLSYKFEKRYLADYLLFDELRTCIQEDNLGRMRVLLASGLPPNYFNPYTHQTPLMMAVQYGTLEMMELLLQQGAFVNIVDLSAISWHLVGLCATTGDVKKLELLLDYGAWLPKDIVIYAAYSGSLEMLKKVESLGHSLEHVAEERFMLPGERGQFLRPTPLQVASKKNYFDLMTYILYRCAE